MFKLTLLLLLSLGGTSFAESYRVGGGGILQHAHQCSSSATDRLFDMIAKIETVDVRADGMRVGEKTADSSITNGVIHWAWVHRADLTLVVRVRPRTDSTADVDVFMIERLGGGKTCYEQWTGTGAHS